MPLWNKRIYHDEHEHTGGGGDEGSSHDDQKPTPLPIEHIWIYKSVDVVLLKKHEAILSDLLFKMPKDSKHHFFIDPMSGFVTYSDETQMWSNLMKNALPESSAEARDCVSSFMKESNAKILKNKKRFKNVNTKETEEPTFLFPAGAIFLDAYPVFHYKTFYTDHWLVRFGVTLPTGTKHGSAKVDGAVLEFRVGNAKQIIGMNIKWRLVKNYRKIPLLSFVDFNNILEPSEMHTNGESEDEKTLPEIVYMLSDENEFQKYVMPYYKTLFGHHSGYNPATSMSLMIKAYQVNNKDSISITLVPIAGSGEYIFLWFDASIEDFWNNTYSELGSGSIVNKNGITYSTMFLPKKNCSLLMMVQDVKTEVIVQIELMVYALTDNDIPQTIGIEKEIAKELTLFTT